MNILGSSFVKTLNIKAWKITVLCGSNWRKVNFTLYTGIKV